MQTIIISICKLAHIYNDAWDNDRDLALSIALTMLP